MKLVSNFDLGQVFHDACTQERKEVNMKIVEILNEVMERKADPIVKVELRNSFYSGGENRGTLPDLDAWSKDGEEFEIALIYGNQNYYHYCFKVCLERHTQMALNSIISKDGRYYILISFVDGILFPNNDSAQHTFKYLENKLGIPLYDRMENHVIELGKFETRREIN